jgi:hypothetical protein
VIRDAPPAIGVWKARERIDRHAISIFTVQFHDVCEGRVSERLSAIVGITLLVGCTHLNYYDGADAAFIPVPCGPDIRLDFDPPRHVVAIEVNAVDGTFTGSGQQCKDHFVYHIRPGRRRLTVVLNYYDPADPARFSYGKADVVADLRPGKLYELSGTSDGSSISITLTDPDSGVKIAEGSTTDISY